VEAETGTLVEFVMPSLGSDMEEGTVIEWLVQVGDTVRKGDVLLRVDTEKSDIDVETWHDARIAEILAMPGDKVPVGEVLARIDIGASDHPRSHPVETTMVEPVAVETGSNEVSAARTKATLAGEVIADPRLVYWPSPTSVPSSVVEPSRGQEQAPKVAPSEYPQHTRATRRQGVVAELMARSNREIPHFHVTREIDVTDALAWLDRHNADVEPPERILAAAVLLYCVAQAANRISIVNGTYADGPIGSDHVDLAVAVHVRGGGLVTPVLPAAETMALDVLMVELQMMVARARSGRMTTRDMSSASLTVTNLGDSGADLVIGVIQPPQRALVGFGRVIARPIVVDGAIVARSTLVATLSADHRVVNGHAGSRFLDVLAGLLAAPQDFAVTLDTDAQDPSSHDGGTS